MPCLQRWPTLPPHSQDTVSALVMLQLLFADVCCALVVHGIYHKYEVEPANIPATLLLLIAVPALPHYFLATTSPSSSVTFILSYLLFYLSLTCSIIAYRVSPVHPLANYPGPISLKVSKLIGMYHASTGKQHTFLKSLHDKYGPFVRVGPNELSIAGAEAIIPVFGGMRKGPMWDSHSVPGTPANIGALRSIEEHAIRRKLWNHGFTTTALKEFQPIVENRIVEFVEELGKRVSTKSGQEITVNITEWLGSFIFDLMGDLVFGEGFGLMARGGKCETRSVIEGHMRSISILGNIPWIAGMVHKVAIVPEGQRRFLEFASNRYDIRKAQGTTRKDLFHYITNEEELEKTEVSKAQGINDVLAAIIAGADTTSTVISGVFYYLLSNRSVFDRLREEVDSAFPLGEGEPFDTSKLAKMPYLNAVINEALRLQPPVPTNLQRSPREGNGGSHVGGRFIPENTALFIPLYVLHRDGRYFSPHPDTFIPERWLDAGNGKFSTDVSAFIPFSSGFANCVGKNLAWMEMRMTVVTIVQKFDMKFAEGYDPKQWEEELQDFITMKVGELPVVLHARG